MVVPWVPLPPIWQAGGERVAALLFYRHGTVKLERVFLSQPGVWMPF